MPRPALHLLAAPARVARLLLLASCCAAVAGWEDSFREQLLLRPLRDGRALLHFSFDLQSGAPSVTEAGNHTTGFPRALAALLASSGGARGFSLTLGRGVWEADWGEEAPGAAAPPGAALSASWPPDAPAAAREAGWRALAHGLGGLLCASLGDLAASAGPGGAEAPHALSASARFAQLPREPLCTENLAPFLALLPCGEAGGLAGLLVQRGPVLSARLLRLRLSASAPAGAAPRARQALTLVLQPRERARLSLRGLLGGRSAPPRCLAAAASALLLALPPDSPWRLSPASPAPHSREALGGGELLGWRLRAAPLETAARLELRWAAAAGGEATPPPPGVPRWPHPPGPIWRAESWLSGQGDAARGLQLGLWREGEVADGVTSGVTDGPPSVSLLQLLPHWARLRFATLCLSVDDGPPVTLAQALRAPGGGAHLVPPRWRAPGALDLILPLPRNASRLRLSASLRIAHGRLGDLPPDAARGADLAPARLALRWAGPGPGGACDEQPPWPRAPASLRCALLAGWAGDAHGERYEERYEERHEERHELVRYTAGLLLPLPAPDASMPFNVVGFVCTAVALLHASLIAVLTHRRGFSERRAGEEAALAAAGHAEPSRAQRLRARLARARKAKSE